MSERKRNVILAFSALLIGLILYVLFRPQTYIAKAVIKFLHIDNHQMVRYLNCPFLKYYFPDFLWCFALAFGLQAIFLPALKGTMLCCLAAFLYGLAWECGQYLGLLDGTGDVLDILMYLLSAFACLLLKLKEKRYEKG